MRRVGLGIVLLLALISAGCSLLRDHPKPHLYRGDEKAAEAFVKSKGYQVIGYMSPLKSYTLTKSLLGEVWESQAWSVQHEPPEKYFGREITTYGFIVGNHPLSKLYRLDIGVCIMMTEGRVIGGYSFPHSDQMTGGVYSLEGKTLEEQTGQSYANWKTQWDHKYGDGAAE